MTECTCPHGDTNEPDHDRACPSWSVFNRIRAQQVIARCADIYRDRNTGMPRSTYDVDVLITQLKAAIAIIDAVPTDVLAKIFLPEVSVASDRGSCPRCRSASDAIGPSGCDAFRCRSCGCVFEDAP